MKQIFMNSKEVKQINKLVEEQWNTKFELDCAFSKNPVKDKLYIITRDVAKIDFNKIKINSLGLYIGELKNHQLRLSIEGSQILGPNATKNVIELSNEQLKEWMEGEEINIKDIDSEGFVIIKHNNDFFGSGKIKDGKLLNYVPKTRRLKFI